MSQEQLQRRTIELIRLPDLDLTDIATDSYVRKELQNKLLPQIETGKFYVVSVKTKYVSGRGGNIRSKVTNYIVCRHFADVNYLSISGYPTHVLDSPNTFFNQESQNSNSVKSE